MIKEGLTFDDVLLVPQYSEIESRSNVDLSIKMPKLPKYVKWNNPIIPANMKSITEFEMAKCIADMSGLAIVHRFMSLEDQLDIVNKFVCMTEEHTVDYSWHVGYSVGVKKESYQEVDDLIHLGANILCVDVAHGDSKLSIDMCQYISKIYPKILLIAGNVGTGAGAKRLWEAGVDIVKVGVGPGSLCTTRIETGTGVPQLTALMDVAEVQQQLQNLEDEKYPHEKKRKFPFISDGGLKNAGDCVKALCFADMVMAGNLFSGSFETPGATINMNGLLYKEYVGSSTHKSNHIEGVKALVPQKGSTKDIMIKLLEGIRSGCSYQGAHNLNELKNNSTFIRITNAGLKESHPHDVLVIK